MLFLTPYRFCVLIYARQTAAMAVGLSNLILFWVQMLNMFEVNGNSLERLQQYMVIEQEPKPVDSGVPPAYWPSSGSIKVENLSTQYSPVRWSLS